MCIYMHGRVYAVVHIWGQRKICRSWFYPSIMRVLGLELKSSDLEVNAFTH